MNVTVEERFLKVLKKVLEVENESIGEGTDFASLGLNSISYIKLVVALEEEFGIEFSDEDLDIAKFDGLKSILAYIEGKL